MSNKQLAITALVGLMTLTGIGVYAGPITPPAGPVASTAKPLADIEPRTAINAANTPGDADSIFVINQSGSYYLTANFSVQSGKNAVKIVNTSAQNVTLDLNGFTIRGVTGSLVGIKTTSSVGSTTLHIRNGAIVSLGGNGIDISAQASSFSDVSVEYCASGFVVAGNSAAITNCRAFSNSADGFNVAAGGVISGCTAELNTASGYTLSSGAQRLERSVATYNSGKAVAAGYGTVVSDCRINGVAAVLVSLAGGCTLERCNISLGNTNAVHASGTANVIQDNALSGSGPGATGVLCDSVGNFVVRNTASGFATAYSIPAGSFVGPIVNTSAGMATASPWANFAY